jgi:DNA-binding phage protein
MGTLLPFPSPRKNSVTDEQRELLEQLAELLSHLAPDRQESFLEEVMRQRKAELPTISERLREAIAASGLTQTSIGEKAGISPNIISRFVAGKRSPTLDTVDRIAAALGLVLVLEKDIK